MTQAIRRGDIYHRYFQTTTPPKYKFFVVVGEDSDNVVGYFFVNSNINKYVAMREEMFALQMPIKADDYPFLDYASFVAGHQLYRLSKSTLLQELIDGRSRFKGRLKAEDLSALLDRALESPLFSEQEKRFFK